MDACASHFPLVLATVRSFTLGIHLPVMKVNYCVVDTQSKTSDNTRNQWKWSCARPRMSGLEVVLRRVPRPARTI